MSFSPITAPHSSLPSSMPTPKASPAISPSFKPLLWDPKKNLTSPKAKTRFIMLQAANRTLKEFSFDPLKQKSCYKALLENDHTFFEKKAKSLVQNKQLSSKALQFQPALLQSILTLRLQSATLTINQLSQIELLFYERLENQPKQWEIYHFYSLLLATSSAKQVHENQLFKAFTELHKILVAESFLKSLLTPHLHFSKNKELLSKSLLQNMLLHLNALFHQKDGIDLEEKRENISCFTLLLSEGWRGKLSKEEVMQYFLCASNHHFLEHVLTSFFSSTEAPSISKDDLFFYLQETSATPAKHFFS